MRRKLDCVQIQRVPDRSNRPGLFGCNSLRNQRLVSSRIEWIQGPDVGSRYYLTLTDEGKDVFGREVFSASQLMRLYFP